MLVASWKKQQDSDCTDVWMHWRSLQPDPADDGDDDDDRAAALAAGADLTVAFWNPPPADAAAIWNVKNVEQEQWH